MKTDKRAFALANAVTLGGSRERSSLSQRLALLVCEVKDLV